jgi:putative transposase
MTSPCVSYKRHRFPPAIIAHAVWVYFPFPRSLRLVEEMLQERGIVASYETVRRWAMKFGRDYARRLKRKRASRRDIWHLDEVVVTIGGKQHCCGGRSIRTDISSMKSSRRDATPMQQSAC